MLPRLEKNDRMGLTCDNLNSKNISGADDISIKLFKQNNQL